MKIPDLKVEKDTWTPENGMERAYPYALVYRFGEMYLGKREDISEWDEVLEARFFDADSELHIWNDGDGWHSALVIDDTAPYLEQEWYNAYSHTGVTVRRYLCADEDGQMQIALTRLASYKEG